MLAGGSNPRATCSRSVRYVYAAPSLQPSSPYALFGGEATISHWVLTASAFGYKHPFLPFGPSSKPLPSTTPLAALQTLQPVRCLHLTGYTKFGRSLTFWPSAERNVTLFAFPGCCFPALREYDSLNGFGMKTTQRPHRRNSSGFAMETLCFAAAKHSPISKNELLIAEGGRARSRMEG